MTNKRKDKKKIPQLRKDIKDFLSKEEGNIVKKDVVKMGMSLLMLGIGLKDGLEVKARTGIPDNDICELCDCPGGDGLPPYNGFPYG